MNENYFTFGDKFFHKKRGTAMSTSMAKEWATRSFGWHKRTKLIPDTVQIKLYKRFTDDIFGLWLDPNLPLHLTES